MLQANFVGFFHSRSFTLVCFWKNLPCKHSCNIQNLHADLTRVSNPGPRKNNICKARDSKRHAINSCNAIIWGQISPDIKLIYQVFKFSRSSQQIIETAVEKILYDFYLYLILISIMDEESTCEGRFLPRNGGKKTPLQVQDRLRDGPHWFPGFLDCCSWMFPEQLRNKSELAGSRGTHQALTRLPRSLTLFG